MPNYEAKITRIMFDPEFEMLMKVKTFAKPRHRALVALLYLSGVRVSEALKSRRKQFNRTTTTLYFDVGKRLKHSKETPALPISLQAPHVNDIIDAYLGLDPETLIFPYTRRTAHHIVKRFFAYPHFYRQNRITRFFLEGYTIPEVKAWTGLNVSTLDYYVSMASMIKMGKSLKSKGGGSLPA